MRFFDSHCHLDDPRFDTTREAVLDRAVGLSGMVVPAVTGRTWCRTLRVVRDCARKDLELYAALGLHPWFMQEHVEDDLELLDEALESHKVVAVGECGLDFQEKDPEPFAASERQEALFEAQLQLAQKHHRPVVVHSRAAMDRVLWHLRQVPGVQAQLHGFVGSEQQAKQALDQGCLLGFGGNITYDRAQRLRRVAQMVPDEALLIETDAPDQSPVSHKDELNEPGYLPEVIKVLAELRGQTPEHIAEISEANARRLFGLKEPL